MKELLEASTESLLNQAAALRDAHWGKNLTYSRKVFIPLTNMCRDECGYCVFVKHPPSGEAKLMSPEEVLVVAKQGEATGCKEALFSLGEKPELRYEEARTALEAVGHTRLTDYLREMCQLVLSETTLIPHVNAGTLSSEELSILKEVSGSMGIMLESTSNALMKKGQAHYHCPDKVPAKRLDTLREAGRQQIPFTTGILIGIGETWSDRVNALEAIATVAREHGNIQECIVQNFVPKPGIAMADALAPTHEEMLRTIAVARLILPANVSLQAPPNLEEDYASYIEAGLNDWGGISPITKDFINPEKAWPQLETLNQTCESQGFQLRERLTIYQRYLKNDAYMHPSLVERLKSLATDEGFAKVELVS